MCLGLFNKILLRFCISGGCKFKWYNGRLNCYKFKLFRCVLDVVQYIGVFMYLSMLTYYKCGQKAQLSIFLCKLKNAKEFYMYIKQLLNCICVYNAIAFPWSHVPNACCLFSLSIIVHVVCIQYTVKSGLLF